MGGINFETNLYVAFLTASVMSVSVIGSDVSPLSKKGWLQIALNRFNMVNIGEKITFPSEKGKGGFGRSKINPDLHGPLTRDTLIISFRISSPPNRPWPAKPWNKQRHQ